METFYLFDSRTDPTLQALEPENTQLYNFPGWTPDVVYVGLSMVDSIGRIRQSKFTLNVFVHVCFIRRLTDLYYIRASSTDYFKCLVEFKA